jgi:hypothetical protein
MPEGKLFSRLSFCFTFCHRQGEFNNKFLLVAELSLLASQSNFMADKLAAGDDTRWKNASE